MGENVMEGQFVALDPSRLTQQVLNVKVGRPDRQNRHEVTLAVQLEVVVYGAIQMRRKLADAQNRPGSH